MKIVDIDTLKQNFDGDIEFILEITKEYCESSKIPIKKLLQAYNNNDWEEMLSLIHYLKGSSKTIYAEEISEIFVELENQLKEKRTDDLKNTFSKIQPAFDKLKNFVNQLNKYNI